MLARVKQKNGVQEVHYCCRSHFIFLSLIACCCCKFVNVVSFFPCCTITFLAFLVAVPCTLPIAVRTLTMLFFCGCCLKHFFHYRHIFPLLFFFASPVNNSCRRSIIGVSVGLSTLHSPMSQNCNWYNCYRSCGAVVIISRDRNLSLLREIPPVSLDSLFVRR